MAEMDDGTIYSPPSEVIVIAYVWTTGTSSGGRREVVLSLREAERLLSKIIADGDYREGSIQVQRLVYGRWEPLAIEMPTDLRLVATETSAL